MDVLVVDDKEINLKTLSRLLSHKGLECATATAAGEALQFLKTHRIPLVISDIDMPGMNGVELALQIRARRSDTVLFAFTGSSGGDLLTAAEEVFDRVFEKPGQITSLVDAAVTALESLRVKA
jgi:CheY-like chemotaxis protein